MLGMQPQTSPSGSADKAVTIWLVLCLGLVALMVILGGLTRLTESGLSIVEWKPISGILPPISDAQWTEEFSAYQATPQFKKSFPGMQITEFKRIYWLEYLHRLAGRSIGLVFLLPLVCFGILGMLSLERMAKLLAIFALGFGQGLIGWYMVKSGLVNEPRVSPYLLAFHLGLGFTIFGLIGWQGLSAAYPKASAYGFELPPPPLSLKLFACAVVALIFLQAILGASVAGLHAGLTYNTFPRMDGQWIPDGLWPSGAWYKDLFEDITTAQFCHRMMAYVMAAAIPLFWVLGRNNPHVVHLLPILFSIFVIQFLLGVLTLLFVVPLPLASLHQTNALLLFGIAVTILHRLFIPLKYISYGMDGKSALA